MSLLNELLVKQEGESKHNWKRNDLYKVVCKIEEEDEVYRFGLFSIYPTRD